MDLGIHMLDLGWYLLGQPKATSVFGVAHQKFAEQGSETVFDVEDAAFAMIRFENGKSLELATSWSLNQPPSQNGAMCRLYGSQGAIELYTPDGPVLYRSFGAKGECKENPLKGPKVVNHAALARHFRECIKGEATPVCGGAEGVALMEMVEAVYKSAETGRSVAM